MKYRLGAESKKRLSLDVIKKSLKYEVLNSHHTDYINGVTSFDCVFPKRLVFIEKFSENHFKILDGRSRDQILYVLSEEFPESLNISMIRAKDPRDVYSKIACLLFDYSSDYWVHYLSSDEIKKIHPNSTIMSNVKIHRDSALGENCVIFPGVVIGPNCKIGKNVLVKSNSVIGQSGFGVYRKENKNHHLPHLGGVVIEDGVEVGALTTVCSGTIHPTVIEENTFIDDHVHIGHNCWIGARVQIAANAIVSGSVKVGMESWISPNVSITDNIQLGHNVFVGIGCNVTRNIDPKTKVGGSSFRIIGENS